MNVKTENPSQMELWKTQRNKADNALGWIEREVAEYNAEKFASFSITGN